MTYMFPSVYTYIYNRFILQTRLIGRGSDELFFHLILHTAEHIIIYTRTYFTRGDDVILMQAIQHKYDKYVLYGVLTFSDNEALKYTHIYVYININIYIYRYIYILQYMIGSK